MAVGRTFVYRTRLTSLFLSLAFVYGACASAPPAREYTLARTALDAARRVDAARYAPAFFHKAEEAYRRGEGSFRDGDYSVAEKGFQQARQYAEKAENVARVQRGGGE